MNVKSQAAIHLFSALAAGSAFYYYFSPDVLFVKVIDELTGGGIHASELLSRQPVIVMIRNYLPDMLWGYALVLSLWLIVGNGTAKLERVFLSALIFSAAVECLQLVPGVRGTFDLWDIAAEAAAEGIAVFIIKHLVRREIKHEKDNEGNSCSIVSDNVCDNGHGERIL